MAVVLASAPGTGAHTFVEDVNDDNAGILSLGSGQDAVISSDGHSLYLIADGDSVTVFARDAWPGASRWSRVTISVSLWGRSRESGPAL